MRRYRWVSSEHLTGLSWRIYIQLGVTNDHNLENLSGILYTLWFFWIWSLENLESEVRQKKKALNKSHPLHLISVSSLWCSCQKKAHPKDLLYHQLLQWTQWVCHHWFWLQDLVLRPFPLLWQNTKTNPDFLVVQWLRISLRCKGHGFKPLSRKISHSIGQLSQCTTATDAHMPRAQ